VIIENVDQHWFKPLKKNDVEYSVPEVVQPPPLSGKTILITSLGEQNISNMLKLFLLYKKVVQKIRQKDNLKLP